jgi:hypothetical protein
MSIKAEKIDKIALENCPPNELLITRFIGVQQPDLAWFFLFGPLYLLAFKQYIVLVTDKSYIFLQLEYAGSLFGYIGKPKLVGKFSFSEIHQPIASIEYGGLSAEPIGAEFEFKFPNERILSLKVSKDKSTGFNDKVRELFMGKAG